MWNNCRNRVLKKFIGTLSRRHIVVVKNQVFLRHAYASDNFKEKTSEKC